MASSHQHGGYQAYGDTAMSPPAMYRAQYEQPQQHQQHQQQQQAGGDTRFTPEMRDRQARGKDPYRDSGDESDDSDLRQDRSSRREESFATVDKRRHAASILDCPELLMMAAQREGASIPATRLRYTRMLCGIDESRPSQNRKKSSHHGQRTPGGGSSSKRTSSGRTSR